MNYESRSLIEPVEFRSAGAGRIVASGVAMRYGAVSKPLLHKSRGVFRETFAPGAFAKTIQESDVRSHNEHAGPYLARSGSGSLRLTDDRSMLAYEIDLPDTSAGRDAAALLERGDIKGSSIGFRSIPAREVWTDSPGMSLRTVTEARLFRVDLTTSPAYDDSTAEMALRSLATEHHLDLDEVIDAAATGELRHLLDREVEDEQQETVDDRANLIVRPRISHLYV